MDAIKNKWNEKVKNKKEKPDSSLKSDTSNPKKRFSVVSTANLVKTLRGVRK